MWSENVTRHFVTSRPDLITFSLEAVLSWISESDVTCDEVWWPILGICALHLTHPKCTHTAVNTHTHCEHTPGAVGGRLCCSTQGTVGSLVPCSRVSAQSWYWRWRERCTFTPPTYKSCRAWDLNSQLLDYESDSLTIRPRLSHPIMDSYFSQIQ